MSGFNLRTTNVLRFALALVVCAALLTSAAPASANVSKLVLHRRTCSVVSAYAVYDGFSGGSAPFYAVFTADIDGDGNFGENNEPKVYAKLNPNAGEAVMVNSLLRFRAPEGTVIAVTAYEVDSAGTLVSGQLPPVSYTCANRPAYDPLPPDSGLVIPGVTASVTARVKVESMLVYALPSADSAIVGGLGIGQVANVRARNQRGDWMQIEYNGGLGWIMWMTQAQLFGPYQSLPIVK